MVIVAKSPRMVPGAASSTLVAPTIERTSENVLSSGPSTTMANTGDRVRNVTSSPKNGSLDVLGVVLLGQGLVGRPQLGGHQREALALEAGHDLPDQAALHGVGLAHHEGPVHAPERYRTVTSRLEEIGPQRPPSGRGWRSDTPARGGADGVERAA